MRTLLDLFLTFERHGDTPAFIYRTGVRRFTYSYQWLYEHSLKMASWLESRGVEKGDRVIIWAPNSPWWAVAFWGTIARGAIVVPVDFMSGRDRAEKIIQLTEAKIVIQSQYKINTFTSEHVGKGANAQAAQLDHLHTFLPAYFYIEDLEYILPQFSISNSQFSISPNETAELIYTSGTTGDPKGVILTHKNLIANMEQINQHVPVVNEKWNFLSVLPLSHTFEQMAGFLTPLYRGGKIIYMRTLKPSAIMEALESEDIYAFPIVPRLLQALKMSIDRELESKHLDGIFRWLLRSVGTRRGASLRSRKKWFFPIHKKFGRHFQFFISGGAALPKDIAEFWMGMGFRVIEGYGITECSPVLTANTFDEQIIGSTGKPLPGVEIKINKSTKQENNSLSVIPDFDPGSKNKNQKQKDLNSFDVSVGFLDSRLRGNDKLEGEILAKGPNVFPGYYQNEEATKKAFIRLRPDLGRDFGGRAPEELWFRTGDIGSFDADGNLHIKGRAKEMIVTGAGINVYPDDIEPVLLSIPGVKDACVIGKNTPEGEEVHAVLILGDPGRDAPRRVPTEERAKSIIDQANAKLDTLQQITGFTLWPEKEFPKTSTMKVQKFKIKQFVENVGVRHGAPLQVADILTSIIATITGKPSNEISESSILVSDLGLTSIARLELVNTLEQEFRLDMEDTAITQTTSVAELRKMIEKREKVHGKVKSHMWIHSTFGRAIQYIMDNLLNWQIFRFFIKLKVEGLENLQNRQGPVIFIGNHISYLDGPCVYASLPAQWRYHLASAAGAFLFFESNASLFKRVLGRIYFEYMTLLCGVFLVTQDSGGFRKSLTFMGKLIDRGVSLLFFPEGGRSPNGILQPFQTGLGLIVKELKVPVVPFKLVGPEKLMPVGAIFPKRGHATIRYGTPMSFSSETPSQIIEQSKNAIELL